MKKISTLLVAFSFAFASHASPTSSSVYGSVGGKFVTVMGLAAKGIYKGLRAKAIETDAGERGGYVFTKTGPGFVCTLAYQTPDTEHEYDCHFGNLSAVDVSM